MSAPSHQTLTARWTIFFTTFSATTLTLARLPEISWHRPSSLCGPIKTNLAQLIWWSWWLLNVAGFRGNISCRRSIVTGIVRQVARNWIIKNARNCLILSTITNFQYALHWTVKYQLTESDLTEMAAETYRQAFFRPSCTINLMKYDLVLR